MVDHPSPGELPVQGYLDSPAQYDMMRSSGRMHATRRVVSSYEPAEDDAGESLTIPAFILRSMYHWWTVAIPAAAMLCMISAGFVLANFKPVYRAAATLRISENVPFIAYETLEAPGKWEEFVNTQIELLKRPPVLRAVANLPAIKELPEVREARGAAGFLARGIKVTRVGKSELYSVSFDGPTPEGSAIIINAVVDEFLRQRSKDDVFRVQRVLELLEQEKSVRAREVHRLRENMRELRKDMDGRPPAPGQEEMGTRHHPIDDLQERLTQAEVDRRMLEAQMKALEEIVSKSEIVVPDLTVELALSDSPEITNLRTLLMNKKANLATVEAAAAKGRNDPSYLRLAREVNDLEKSLANMVKRTRPVVAEQVKSLTDLERRDELEKIKVRLENAKVLEGMLRERFREQLQVLEKSGDKALELEFKRSELALEEKVFEMIAERSMALGTEMRAPGRVALDMRADVPPGPMESFPIRDLLLACMGSCVVPFAVAVGWEALVRRISHVEQLSPLVDSSILGEIAHLPKVNRVSGMINQADRTLKLFEESINNLRVCLVLPEYHRHVKVIAVTSAIHSEGKSSVASQLAVSIARACGEPTLLIDGDMRSPDMHRIFNLTREPGLSKVLDRMSTLEQAIVTGWSEHLHILPAGKLHRSPHMLLGGSSFGDLINTLRQKYRYIVIDTPPVLSAAESLILARHADGVLLCTRRNYSRENQVKMAHQRLVAAGAKPLGAVFNAVPTTRYAYTYGDYDYAGNTE